MTGPLSLRGDNHSEKLTGCPEARESEAEERRRRRKESGESGIIASLSRRENHIYHEIKMKKKKRNSLSLSVHPSASQTPLRRVVNKRHNSVRMHNRPVNQDQRPI